MKNILPFFAACALFAGVACSTYTSTTDPNDKGSGSALTEDVTTTAAVPAEEAHEASTHAKAETTEAAAPATETAAPTTAEKAPAAEAAHTEEAAH